MLPKEPPAATVEGLLAQSLRDRHLSGGEKEVLRQLLDDAHADEQKLAFHRHRAFDLARAEMIDPAAVKLLDWLEEVVKVLQPGPRKEQIAESEAFFGPGDECPNAIIRLLTRTRQRADLCVFTITDDRISSAILAAHRRGVALRIITDNEKAFDLGSDIERLAKAGIPLRIDRTPFHMHHKYAVFDGEQLLTGSYNWTRSAAEVNMENLVVTSDPRLVTAFLRNFERAWQLLA